MKYFDPTTGKDEPPVKNWRNLCATMGPDFASLPREWWGWRDWEQAEARNRPLNQTLPPPPPDRSLHGFSLFPGKQQAKPTAGDRAVREIRSSKADAALKRLGLRR